MADFPTVTKIGIAISAVLFCSFTCLFAPVLIPRDDCMDNDLLYSLTSDGKTLLTGVEWQSPKDLLKNTRYMVKEQIPITYKVRNFKEGEQTLRIHFKGKTYSHTFAFVSDLVWSRKHETLFFVDHKEYMTQHVRVGFWNAKQGFGSIGDYKSGSVSSSGLSSDEEYMAIGLLGIEDQQTRLLLSSLTTRQEQMVTPPSWAKKHIMMSNGNFLLFRHDRGNYGQVYLWNAFKPEEPKTLGIDGNIIDALAFNGHVWGLRMFGSPPHLVRLGPTGTTVEEDLGPIPGP